jgi:uncharacterized protein Veg
MSGKAVGDLPEKTMGETQSEVKELVGHPVRVVYHNRGREVADEGTITAAFGNLFIFEFVRRGHKFRSSFTYVDVLTDSISLEPLG